MSIDAVLAPMQASFGLCSDTVVCTVWDYASAVLYLCEMVPRAQNDGVAKKDGRTGSF